MSKIDPREQRMQQEEERFQRLPEWAKARIQNLQRRVAELTQALADEVTREGLPWYNAQVPDPRDDRRLSYIPTPHRSVRFLPGEDAKTRYAYIDVRLGDAGNLRNEASPRLIVQASGPISVLPHASNVVNVELLR